ncbi:MAG: PAS domain S-box protein, partial [Bacteroidetes bacterium]|nr:PAS domain S-box protein [Bacteroidota bacterium]
EPEKNNILLITDSPSDVDYLVVLLRDSAKINFEYRLVLNALELEIALKEREWDLVLCNFVLATLSSVDVIKLVKHSQPTTPIILVSEGATVQVAVDMMRLGASGFVEKTDYLRLIEFVRQALETRHLTKESDESYYESIIKYQTELICRYDADFRLTFANRAYSEWYEQPIEALLGSNILDNIPAEYRERAIAHVKTLTFDSPVAKLVYQDSLPGQKLRWIEWTNRAIFDKSGRFIEYQSVGRDITEHKRIEEKLLYSEAQQKALLSANPDLLFRITPEGIFVEFHGPQTDLLVPPEAFIGKHIQDILPSWVANRSLEAIKQVDLTRQPVIFEYELFFQADMHFFEARFAPLDNTEEVLAIIRDITARKRAEAALRDSEEKYRSLIESSDGAFSMVDSTGRYLYLNRIAAVPFGVEPEQLMGKTVHDLFPPSQANNIMADINRVITLEKGLVLEPEVTLAGKSVWFRTSLQPIRDSTGKPYAALIYASEITDKKMAEREILMQNELLRQSRNLIAMSNLEGQITFMNRGGAIMLGYDQPEMFIGKQIADFHLPEDAERALNEYLPYALKNGQWSGENRLKTPDGRLIDVEQTIFPILNDSGNILQAATIMVDITQRKHGEEALRQSETRFKALVENSPDFIVRHNIEFELLYANPAAAQLYGESAESLIGKTPEKLAIDQNVLQPWQEFALKVIETGQEQVLDYEITLFGQVFYLQTRIVPEFNTKKQLVSLLSITRDLTSLKQAQNEVIRSKEQLFHSQKMEMVGRLAGGVAHDFNNLLTVIQAYAEIIANGLHSQDPLLENAQEIKKAGEKAAALTKQLLAFSRRQRLQPKVLNLNNTILDIEKMLKRLIGDNVEIMCELDRNLGMVMADPVQVELIIINLAVNARDAMRGVGSFKLKTSNVQLDEGHTGYFQTIKPGQYVLLEASDTGCGMDNETLSHIFEPFFTTKEPGKGTGLGLATVYGIIQQSQSYISVYSEPGLGSVFKIYLPKLEGISTPEVVEQPVVNLPTSGSETILLVEDENLIRKLARALLRKNGYTVLEAENGHEALEMYRNYGGKIDLLISDMVMPRMGGKELSVELAKHFPDLKILLMSGYSEDMFYDDSILLSTDFIQKPFSSIELVRKVRLLLDRV